MIEILHGENRVSSRFTARGEEICSNGYLTGNPQESSWKEVFSNWPWGGQGWGAAHPVSDTNSRIPAPKGEPIGIRPHPRPPPTCAGYGEDLVTLSGSLGVWADETIPPDGCGGVGAQPHSPRFIGRNILGKIEWFRRKNWGWSHEPVSSDRMRFQL